MTERNANFKLTYALPSVNSSDYHLFRKKHNDETHQEIMQQRIVAYLKKNKIEASYENVGKVIFTLYDNEEHAKAPSGSEERQLLQYLGQLSDKGWNRLINSIRTRMNS